MQPPFLFLIKQAVGTGNISAGPRTRTGNGGDGPQQGKMHAHPEQLQTGKELVDLATHPLHSKDLC